MYVSENALVSVITPSYNQAAFIRETIESVLSQDYPDLEHIVVDGGSTDGTLAILQEYAAKDSRFRFISEPDEGQSHAINKGIHLAQGKVIGWLNSDDTYLPGAVKKAILALRQHPEWALVYGRAFFTDANNQTLHEYPVEPFSHEGLFRSCFICQPAAFIRKDVLLEVGGVDHSLQFCMDYDLWIRIAKRFPLGYLPELLATSRYHADSKTATKWISTGMAEVNHTQLKHYGAISDFWIQENVKAYGPEAPRILLNTIKQHERFGPTPHAVAINRYHDLWAPRRLRIRITQHPDNPVTGLLVKGAHAMKQVKPSVKGPLTIRVNSKRRVKRRYGVGHGDFLLDIPLRFKGYATIVELVASRSFRPSRWRINQDRRRLSFQAFDLIAYTEREKIFYTLMQTNPASVSAWMQARQ